MAYPISSDGIVIPDDATGILLYKDGQLVDISLQSSFGLTIPVDEYDHIFIASNGFVEEMHVNPGGSVTILDGGILKETQVGSGGYVTIQNGGSAEGLYTSQSHIEVLSGGKV